MDKNRQKRMKIQIAFHPVLELKILEIFAKQAGWIFRILVLHFCSFRRKSGKLESCFDRQVESPNDLLVVDSDFQHGATLQFLVILVFKHRQACAKTAKRVNFAKKVLSVVTAKNEDASVYRNSRCHVNRFRIQRSLCASSLRAFFDCPKRTFLICELCV